MIGKKHSGIVVKTLPSGFASNIVEVKGLLDIAADDSKDDSLIRFLMEAADKRFEQSTNRRLLQQTWLAYYNDWPYADENDRMEIPFPPLQSVTTVKYTDAAGAQWTYDPLRYNVDTEGAPGGIVLNYFSSWPNASLKTVNPIEIEFVCGYGSQTSAVPPDIRMALAMMVEKWFHERSTSDLPAFSQAVIDNYRIFYL